MRGAHPTRLLLDEIDEMKLPILEAAQGQPMDRDGVRAQTVMSSTHRYPDGTVTAMRRRAAELGWPVYQWCYRETLEPHGWLTEDQATRKRGELSRTMWATEYELQEPSAEGRAIDPAAVERMFDADRGTHIPAGDLEHSWRGQPGPPPSGSRTKTRQSIVRRVHVTRFRVHIGHCVACGTRVQGRHPSQTSEATGAAAAQVGPEALAFAAILNQEFGLSYGKTVAVRQRGFGLTLTPGGLSQALARLAARCEPTDEHRKAVVRTQPSVTLDETGWRIGGHPAWLHVAATADATVYGIFAGRGFDAAAALIGADYDGCLVRDGWAPYRRFEAAYHQTCGRKKNITTALAIQVDSNTWTGLAIIPTVL